MRIHIHVHHHYEHESLIIHKLNEIMATKQEFLDLLVTIGQTADNIAADIERLIAQIGAGGLTAVEEAEVLAELQTAADRLKGISDVVPE